MQEQEKERVSSPFTDMFLYNRLSASRVSAIGLYVCFYIVAHVSPKKKRKKLLTVGSPLHVKRAIYVNNRQRCLPFLRNTDTYFSNVQMKISHCAVKS